MTNVAGGGCLQLNGVRINSLSSSPTIKATTKFVTAAARWKVSIFKYGPALVLSRLNCPCQLNCIIADATTKPDVAKLSNWELWRRSTPTLKSADAFELHNGTAWLAGKAGTMFSLFCHKCWWVLIELFTIGPHQHLWQNGDWQSGSWLQAQKLLAILHRNWW